MADQEHAGAAEDPSRKPGQDAGTDGSPASGQTEADKTEEMEEVQRDAAKEREENRGYQ